MNIYRVAAVLFAAWCSVNGEYLLTSELQRNFNGGSATTSFLTGYSYDDRGRRIERNAFDGADTSADRISTIRYSYDDSSGRLLCEVLYSGDDTVTIVRYQYNAGDSAVCIMITDASGTEKYRDSLSYDTTKAVIEKRRFSGENLLFSHRFSYDSAGRKTADTLLEPSDNSLTAAQATVFSYNPEGAVLTEKNCRRLGDEWYVARTSAMGYTDGVLSSVTMYDGDGSAGPMLDSTAVFFDANGNRIREQRYDNERALVAIVDFTWVLFVPVIEKPRSRPKPEDISFDNGVLRLNGMNDARVAIFDMRGREVRCQVEPGGIPEIRSVRPATLCPGKYIVRTVTAAGVKSFPFIIAGK